MSETREVELQIAITALTKISEGKGRYDMDRLRHAANTIEDMVGLAKEALKAISEISIPAKPIENSKGLIRDELKPCGENYFKKDGQCYQCLGLCIKKSCSNYSKKN